MSDKYKTYEELKEELGNNYDLFMYEINLCLLQKIDEAIRILNSAKNHYGNDGKNWALERVIDLLKEIKNE